jgi:hypothetical protein
VVVCGGNIALDTLRDLLDCDDAGLLRGDAAYPVGGAGREPSES